MPISQGATNQFKLGLATGLFDFNLDTFRLALYTGAATLDADTAAYTPLNEVTGTGYMPGGKIAVVSVVPTFGAVPGNTTLYLSFENVTWDPANFTARGGLIYKEGAGNPTVCVLDFGADKTATTTFTVQFPTADSSNAIVRIN